MGWMRRARRGLSLPAPTTPGRRPRRRSSQGRLPRVWDPGGTTLSQAADDVRAFLAGQGVTRSPPWSVPSISGVDGRRRRRSARRDDATGIAGRREQGAGGAQGTRIGAVGCAGGRGAGPLRDRCGRCPLPTFARYGCGSKPPAPGRWTPTSPARLRRQSHARWVGGPDRRPRTGSTCRACSRTTDCSATGTSNLVPDRMDALLVHAADARGTADVASRLGLESTGISIPIVARPESIAEPNEEPTLVLIGASHPLIDRLVRGEEARRGALQPGQGAHSGRQEGVR